MLAFLALNDIEWQYTQEELSGMVLSAAAGQLPLEGMVQWSIEHQA